MSEYDTKDVEGLLSDLEDKIVALESDIEELKESIDAWPDPETVDGVVKSMEDFEEVQNDIRYLHSEVSDLQETIDGIAVDREDRIAELEYRISLLEDTLYSRIQEWLFVWRRKIRQFFSRLYAGSKES